MQCIVVQYSAVKCSVVQYSAVLSTKQCTIVQCSIEYQAVYYSTVQCVPVQYIGVPPTSLGRTEHPPMPRVDRGEGVTQHYTVLH